MRLHGKTALITGGSRGIGKAVAELFSEEGAALMLCARSNDELTRTKAELERKGAVVEVCRTDVSLQEDVHALVARTVSTFGNIDLLVNAAGIYGEIGPVARLDFQKWKATFEVNLFGTFAVIQETLPIFIKNKSGKIVNFSGGGDGPLPNFSAYSTSKVALVRFTETLADELRVYGIAVNAIAPGPVNTRILEDALTAGEDLVGKDLYSRFRKQKEDGGVSPRAAAELCLFLASNDSDGLSGKFLSAVWDDWRDWSAKQVMEIMATDRFTLRRKK
jgi:NAD(P)-dependent dehydrogenase (short-subunit alcohol dehydrogenase family)